MSGVKDMSATIEDFINSNIIEPIAEWLESEWSDKKSVPDAEEIRKFLRVSNTAPKAKIETEKKTTKTTRTTRRNRQDAKSFCIYEFTKGKKKDEKCGNPCFDDIPYCSGCRKKTKVKNLLEGIGEKKRTAPRIKSDSQWNSSKIKEANEPPKLQVKETGREGIYYDEKYNFMIRSDGNGGIVEGVFIDNKRKKTRKLNEEDKKIILNAGLCYKHNTSDTSDGSSDDSESSDEEIKKVKTKSIVSKKTVGKKATSKRKSSKDQSSSESESEESDTKPKRKSKSREEGKVETDKHSISIAEEYASELESENSSEDEETETETKSVAKDKVSAKEVEKKAETQTEDNDSSEDDGSSEEESFKPTKKPARKSDDKKMKKKSSKSGSSSSDSSDDSDTDTEKESKSEKSKEKKKSSKEYDFSDDSEEENIDFGS